MFYNSFKACYSLKKTYLKFVFMATTLKCLRCLQNKNTSKYGRNRSTSLACRKLYRRQAIDEDRCQKTNHSKKLVYPSYHFIVYLSK